MERAIQPKLAYAPGMASVALAETAFEAQVVNGMLDL